MVTVTHTPLPNGNFKMRLTVEFEIPKGLSMLEQENSVQRATNEVGLELTRQLLARLDTDGRPLRLGPEQVSYTAKATRVPKEFETPYGTLNLARHVYQSSAGGACYVPLDAAASLIGAATPKFAQMIGHKHTEDNARNVCRDMRDNHQRPVSLEQVQLIAQRVGELAAVHPPQLAGQSLPDPKDVATVAVGVDGASMLMSQGEQGSSDGRKGRTLQWRMAMVGTISLYDKAGERLATFYQAQTPPEDQREGKGAFWASMEAEIARFKDHYPQALFMGLCDGAPDLVAWLEKHTSLQALDYYHAAGYLNEAGAAFFRRSDEAAVWSATARAYLRDEPGAAAALLADMRERSSSKEKITATARLSLDKAIGYFEPRLQRMDYARYQAEGLPIGSGVTESACKLIIKQRLCGPGMRWSHAASQHVLTLRCLLHSDGRWNSLWSKISTPIDSI